MAPNPFVERGFTFDTVSEKGASDVANSLISEVSDISGRDEGALASLSAILEKIDRRLDELEEERAALLFVRNMAMSTASEALQGIEGVDKKRVLYNILEQHTRDVVEISESLDLRESVVRKILRDLQTVLPKNAVS